MPPLVRHVKATPGVSSDFYAVEAAGLRWLAVGNGAPVAEVLDVDERHIAVRRLVPVPPSVAAAEELGRRLAATHAAGAPTWGCPPAGWHGDGFIGRLVLPHVHDGPVSFGEFFAECRLRPFVRAARDAGTLSAAQVVVLDGAARRVADDTAGLGAEPPSRVHGDLWAGNVVWTADGATLIDPAAHGGHREVDLAMLALFGLPHLDRVLAAYDEARPLSPGWRDRVPLHQLHPLLTHVVLFGASYLDRALAAARAVP